MARDRGTPYLSLPPLAEDSENRLTGLELPALARRSNPLDLADTVAQGFLEVVSIVEE